MDKRVDKLKEKKEESFYHDAIVWDVLIDIIPAAFVAKRGTPSSLDINTKTKTKKKIACYKRSTLAWFVDKTTNRNGVFKIEIIPFAKQEEFNLLKKGGVDYAFTLEPWKAKDEFILVEGIPNQAFVFTCILADKSTVYNQEKRNIITNLIGFIKKEVSNILQAFENKAYIFLEEEGLLEKRQDEYVSKLMQFYEDYVVNEYDKPEGVKKGEIKLALQWMADNKIWTIHPIKSIRNFDEVSESMKSAWDLLEEEKQKSIELDIIHNLKNRFNNSVKKYLKNHLDLPAIQQANENINAILNDMNDLIRALNNPILKPFPLEKITFLLKPVNNDCKEQGINFIVEDSNVKGINIMTNEDIFIKMVLEEVIQNAMKAIYYEEEFRKDTGKEGFQEKNIILTIKKETIKENELIKFSIFNNHTEIPDKTVKSAGISPTTNNPEGVGGVGLIKVNRSLEMTEAYKLSNRFFNIENTTKPEKEVVVTFYYYPTSKPK